MYVYSIYVDHISLLGVSSVRMAAKDELQVAQEENESFRHLCALQAFKPFHTICIYIVYVNVYMTSMYIFIYIYIVYVNVSII